jgi:DNA-binding MarR family transcriptional regulator
MEYDKLAEELLENMAALHRAKVQKNIREALHGEAFVLGCIASHDGDMQPGEISQKTDVSNARVTTTLNSLEKKGLITRQIDTSNRRRVFVTITHKGRELAEEHQKTIVRTAREVLEFLGEQDAKDYVRIMKKLTGYLPDKMSCEERV